MGKSGKTFLTEHAEEVYSVHNYMMDAGGAEKQRKKSETGKEQRERIHPIGLIFTLIIIGYICGRTTLPAIHRYLKHREEWLKKLLGRDFPRFAVPGDILPGCLGNGLRALQMEPGGMGKKTSGQDEIRIRFRFHGR